MVLKALKSFFCESTWRKNVNRTDTPERKSQGARSPCSSFYLSIILPIYLLYLSTSQLSIYLLYLPIYLLYLPVKRKWTERIFQKGNHREHGHHTSLSIYLSIIYLSTWRKNVNRTEIPERKTQGARSPYSSIYLPLKYLSIYLLIIYLSTWRKNVKRTEIPERKSQGARSPYSSNRRWVKEYAVAPYWDLSRIPEHNIPPRYKIEVSNIKILAIVLAKKSVCFLHKSNTFLHRKLSDIKDFWCTNKH